MSASREKRKRQNEPNEGGANKTARTDIGTIVFRNFIVVLCVVLVLALIGAVLIGQGVPQQFLTAVSADGENITAAEFNFFYYSSLSDFYSSMGDFLVSYGYLDTSKPLNQQQSWTEGETWHDYLVSATIEKIKSTVQWSKLAKAEGITLTAEDTATIDEILNAAADSAVAQDMSVNKLLSTIYGRGVNENNARKFLERQVLANRYETQLYESFTFTEKEIADHYNANKKLFDKVDYRAFRATKLLSDEEYDKYVEETGKEDLSELVDSPIGEISIEEKLAYDKVAELAANPDLTEENFNDLARELAKEESKEYYDDADYTLNKGASYAEGELGDWLFDESRKRGDVAILEDDNDYITVMFLERIVEDEKTVNMRQILVTPVNDNDAGWNEAESKAKTILETLGTDEQNFIDSGTILAPTLGSEYKSYPYTEMSSSDVSDNEAVKAWLFDEARKHGDVAALKGTSNYHVMFFTSWGRPLWQVNVEETLRTEKNNAAREERSVNTLEPETNWLGMQIISKA